MSVPLCLARPTEPRHTHTCIGRSAPSAVLLSGARRAGPCARPSGRKQATRCLDPRECPAHPRCSERNSESNIEEMTEEEVRGAGLEAGASGMAHLAKSTARHGTVFVQRTTTAHHQLSSNGSFQASTCSDRAARLHRRHEKITAQVREASVTGSPRAAARFDSVMPGQLRHVALSERAAACKSSTVYYVKAHAFHLKMGLWLFRPAFA